MGKAIFTQPPALMRSAANNLSDVFNTERTYAVGEYVIYNNQLYKCTTAIETAGEWDESCWLATSLAGALTHTVNTDLSMRYDRESDYIQLNNAGVWENWKLAGLDFNGVLYNAGVYSRYWGTAYKRIGTVTDVNVLTASYLLFGNTCTSGTQYAGTVVMTTPIDCSKFSKITVAYNTDTTIRWASSIGFSTTPDITGPSGFAFTVASNTPVDISAYDELYLCAYLDAYSSTGTHFNRIYVASITLSN